MHSPDFDYTTKQLSRQPATSITELAIVPALIEKEGPDTKRRFVEFFTANISNDSCTSPNASTIRIPGGLQGPP